MTKKGPWTVLSTKQVYKNPWLSFREDQVLRPNGAPGVYGVLELGEGVIILPLDKDKNVYLAKEYFYAIEKDSIGCPGGKVDQNEEPLEAAKRELKEELGIIAKKWTHLWRTSAIPARVNSVSTAYLAEDLKFSNTNQDGIEKVELVKIPFSEAYEMALDGRIIYTGSCLAIIMTYLLKNNINKRTGPDVSS